MLLQSDPRSKAPAGDSTYERLTETISTLRRQRRVEASPDAAQVARPQASTFPRHGLPKPPTTQPVVLYWPYIISLTLVHLFATLAVVPWFFSVSGVVLCVVGYFICNMFGITIGYHRLLTHRGFKCPLWMERALAICGMCTLQDSPARWVAIHRMHHQHSDHEPDPHTPLAGFWWSHVGWLFVRNRNHEDINAFERFARDLLRDRFYLKAERHLGWLKIYLYHIAVVAVVGWLFGYATGGTVAAATQTMASWLVWGVFVRTVATLHFTWFVNSASHTWGYQNYSTRDDSRNNWWVAALTFGEGWHNNHHAFPRSARHGHHWWELDLSWWMIRFWEKIGLITDVVEPGRRRGPSHAAAEEV